MIDEADDCGQTCCRSGHALDRAFVRGEEACVLDQIADAVAGDAHLWRDEQFCPAGCGFRDGVEDFLRVAVDVAARRVELGQGDAHGGLSGMLLHRSGFKVQGSTIRSHPQR